ncbi:MAG: hypothetical protein ACR2MQ_06895 [Gemmatimonadaceae bacterium]
MPRCNHSGALSANLARLAGLVILAACATSGNGPAVTIAPASTAQRLVFHRVAPNFFYGMLVTTCDGNQIMWDIGTGANAEPAPVDIAYGVAPPGYAVRTAPLPLKPGCYRATVSGPATSEFVVDAAGNVTARQRR